jgi:hypothetical protein
MKMIPVAAATAVAAFTAGVATHALLPAKQNRIDGKDTQESLSGSASVPTTRFIHTNQTVAASSKPSGDLLDRIELAARETDPNVERGKLDLILASLTAGNARDLAETIRKRTDLVRKSEVFESLVTAWGRLDPRAAVAYAQSLPETSLRERAITAALTGWAKADLAGLREWKADLLPTALKLQANGAVVTEMAETNPEQAFDMAFSGKVVDHMPDFPALQSLFNKWVERDPLRAAQRAEGLSHTMWRSISLQNVASEWAKRDPQSAAQWLQQLPSDRYDSKFLAPVLQVWARKDADAVYGWLAQQPSGKERDRLVREATEISRLNRSNPQAALVLAELVTSVEQQDRIIDSAITEWTKQDPNAARQWAEAQTDPGVRSAALLGLVKGIRDADPDTAARLVFQISDETKRQQAADQAVGGLFARDPNAAAQWVSQLTDAAALKGAIPAFAESWMKADASSATEWLFNSVPEGEIRDNTISRLMDRSASAAQEWFASAGDEQRQRALDWVASVSDSKRRDRYVSTVATAWVQLDPSAARQWIAGQTNLSSELKERLLKIPSP